MEAVIGQRVVGAEADDVVQVVGAAQDRLGGVFSFHGAAGLRMRMINFSLGPEPQGHCVGEEAKFTPLQEAVKAVDDDAAFTHIFTAPAAGCSRYGGQW